MPIVAAVVVIINTQDPKARDALQFYKSDELSTIQRWIVGVLVSCGQCNRGLKNGTVLAVRNSKWMLEGQNQSIGRVMLFLGGSRGEIYSLSLPASNCYHSLVCVLITPISVTVAFSLPIIPSDLPETSCVLHWTYLDNPG